MSGAPTAAREVAHIHMILESIQVIVTAPQVGSGAPLVVPMRPCVGNPLQQEEVGNTNTIAFVCLLTNDICIYICCMYYSHTFTGSH